MRSREECHNASKHASKATGIGNPTLIASNDLKTTPATGNGKRKTNESSVLDLLDDPFIVKAYHSPTFTKPRTLSPVALLLRSQLPLSCLDLALGTLQGSRLFESHVKILELEQRIGSTPVVLIARLDDGKTLFAVERESRGLYVLCKLGSWIDLNKLCAASIVSRSQSFAGDEEDKPHSNCDSQITAEARKYNKKKRLAIEALQSIVKRPREGILSTEDLTVCRSQNGNLNFYPLEETSRRSPQSSLLVESLDQKEVFPANKSSSEDPTSLKTRSNHAKRDNIESLVANEILERPSADQILNSIRSQYFDSLYFSKASLAYFAKGPLSRARAAFQSDSDSTLDVGCLVQFLVNLILPNDLLDKKYKYGVPSILESMIIGEGSLDEAENGISKPKKREKKTTKPDTKGLYPTEDLFLRRWWRTFDIESESREDMMKKRTAQLRIRETQLQIIVILETLALQLAKSQIDHSSELAFTSSKDAKPVEKILGRKPKKPKDLVALLDVHVDRLCIWQSVAAGEEAAPVLVKELRDASDSSGLTKDLVDTCDVREFCNELIVPFFSARLPEQCAAISCKLGGHIISPSTGPKLSTVSNLPVPSSRPGAIAKRRVTSKPGQNLQRVLTDERRARGGVMSLTRSTTSPAVPRLKREASESSLLGNIPHTETQTIYASRGGILKSKKFSQREVDLSSLANANETRCKKLNIEAELKDAITTLKRPNRQLAVQELVEATERRAFTTNNSRKSKKPIRNSMSQDVQIVATPKGNRRTDKKAGIYTFPPLAFEEDFWPGAIASTSTCEVPRSTSNTTREITLSCENQCNVSADKLFSESKTPTKIQATPSRYQKILNTNSLASTRPEDFDELPNSSPLRAKCTMSNTPHTSAIKNLGASKGVVVVEATPIKYIKELGTCHTISYAKPVKEMGHSTSTPNKVGNGVEIIASSMTENENIYRKLGWDDDDLG